MAEARRLSVGLYDEGQGVWTPGSAEIAVAERVNDSYVGRVLRLTLLAPDIVQAILDGLHAPEVTRQRLMRPFPAAWEDQ